jgi:succinyl-diaminopimelate desuccinylase
MSRSLELLRQLVAIPSVNPMGRDLSGPEYFEGRMSDFLESHFRGLGVPCERFEVAPGRANVIARFDSSGAKRTVLLDAHEDTVPTDGMIIDPFTPTERDGRLYGRGSCDVKGGMAAMLAAFERLVATRPAGAANVVMSCTCDEESTTIGIDDLTELWTEPNRGKSLLSERPDAAIVAEPTGLHVVVAHKGASRWKILTRGRACHSSSPQNGINAIYRMAKIVGALERFAAELPSTVPPHPLCGPATLSIGRIQGGISVNTVPDWCEIEVDRRVLPGEDGWAAIERVREFLTTHAGVEFEFLPPWCVGQSLPDGPNAGLAEQLLGHVRAVAGPREKVGVPYGTHASRTAAAGVPSVVFGPGDIQQAHTKDEWIEVAQLDLAAEIYYRFCATS